MDSNQKLHESKEQSENIHYEYDFGRFMGNIGGRTIEVEMVGTPYNKVGDRLTNVEKVRTVFCVEISKPLARKLSTHLARQVRLEFNKKTQEAENGK